VADIIQGIFIKFDSENFLWLFFTVCLESYLLLTGESPVVVITRKPRSRLTVLLGN